MTLLRRCLAAWPLLLTACWAAPGATSDEAGARQLRCAWPDGSSLAVIHRDGLPLALTGGAVAGARECATRSTQPVQTAGKGWRLDWHDEVLGATYRAELQALSGGGFAVGLSRPGWSGQELPGRVGCGPLSLPGHSTLRPADAACRDSEDRSLALQHAWALLRQAVVNGDAQALRRVLADEIELVEGSEQDSPKVAAEILSEHLACVADLTNADSQRLADWARARPNLLVAPTGLDWLSADAVRLGNYASMRWQHGRWQLDWINASRGVLLRDCT